MLQESQRPGHLDLEATEMAIRASRHPVGGVLLEKLLNADGGGHRGPRLDCGQGHLAEFVDYRSEEVLTVLSVVQIGRAYYHCAGCQSGVIPKDRLGHRCDDIIALRCCELSRRWEQFWESRSVG